MSHQFHHPGVPDPNVRGRWEHMFVHPVERVKAVLGLHERGLSGYAISRQMGVPHSTVLLLLSNRSGDIRRVFCEHLDVLGIAWTQSMAYTIQIARRPAVEALDRFIGLKD